MKICSLSDIHGSFIDIPECDVLCIAGDIVDLNNQRSIDASRHWWYNRFTNWVNRLPCKKVIITPGNHDFFQKMLIIIDILITHDNPFNNELLGNVAKHKIAHFYGHWHEGPELRKSGYYNCSLLTDMYNNKNNYEPVIIDTEEQVVEEDDIPWETNLNTEENELITEDLQ